MYRRGNFQENDRTTSCSRRRIRRAVEDQTKLQEETRTAETQKSEEAQKTYLPRDEMDESEERLYLMLERKISNGGEHLIGVFGVNSDTTLNKVLYEIQGRERLIMLQKSWLSMDDVFKMFSGVMLKYMEESFLSEVREDTFYRIKHQLLRYLNDICPDETYREFGGLYELEVVSRKLDRGEKCKELLRFMKEHLGRFGRYDPKFVWNVEIDIGRLNYRLLKDLSQIVCDDLIIVVNSLAPLRVEAQHLGAEFDYGDSEHMGHKLIQKYFCGETLYDT